MRRSSLALLIPLVVGLTYACSGHDDSSGQSEDILDPSCASDTSTPPKALLCTGLYKDINTKTVFPDIEPYAPGTPFWSDGAEKSRWIQLPAGKTIDRTDPNEWKFPAGTTAWKEFKVGGKRVETRMWRKAANNVWLAATYAWNAGETAATISPGGDINGPSGTYHIPTSDECRDCHDGRSDRLLGFEEVSLGLDGATGYTLAKLASDKKLAPAPSSTTLSIGDDGTGGANNAAMGWLHINCGVTCHNTNSSSLAFAAGMNLRMDPSTLTGASATDFQNRQTTLGVPVRTVQWLGDTRIVPGDPDDSLLVQLISRRQQGNQMPPIATSVVDSADVTLVRDWITAMKPSQPGDPIPDAGAPPPKGGGHRKDAGGG